MIEQHPLPAAVRSLAERVGAAAVLKVIRASSSAVARPAVACGEIPVVVCSNDPCMQLAERFRLALIDESILHAQPEVRRTGLHQAVQHLLPGGWLAFAPILFGRPDSGRPDSARIEPTGFAALCAEFEMTPDRSLARDGLAVFRRGERTTVHDLMFEARSTIGRVEASELHRLLDSADPPLVIDTRTHVDRARSGVIAGSIHVPRTVLEWHLDPMNGYRHPQVTSYDQAMVVVCNGGYSSSLAAASLARLGFTAMADLIGGMHAWRASGLPTASPDHSFLDL